MKLILGAVSVFILEFNCFAQGGATRPVGVTDPLYNNMTAYTAVVPANWKFEGALLRGVGCGYEIPGLVYRAYSADGLTGIQSIPPAYWYAADAPRAYKLSFVDNCSKLPGVSAADYGRLISAKVRPGSEVDGVQPAPNAEKFAENLRRFNQQMQSSAASYGNPNPGRAWGDTARLHLHYDLNGHAVEEWMDVTLQTIESTVPIQLSGQYQALRMGQGHLRQTVAWVTLRRAPKGQLNDAQFQVFDKSLKEDDNYRQAYTQRMQQQTQANISALKSAGQAALASGAAAHERLMGDHRQFMEAFQQEGAQRSARFVEQMDRKSRSAQDFNDYVLDQQFYLNPVTGVSGTLPSGYNSFQGPDGSVIQTTGVSTPGPNWVQLQPIRH